MSKSTICAECGRGLDEATEQCPECGGHTRLRGRYQLEEILGSRGSGRTYRAVDITSGEPCVVKELLLRATRDLKELELFEREAQILAALDHPRIPKLLDHFELRRGKSIGLYVVLEFKEGTSLEAELSDRRFTPEEVAGVLADACELLEFLRTRTPAVVHRDIKPANLLRGPNGDLLLVDFGASRIVAESLHKSGSTVTGTFGYMAPEQLAGRAVPASDLYSLGATGLRLLTRQDPALLSTGDGFEWDRSNVDPGLAGLLDRLTAAKADVRPDDLPALASVLRAFASGSAPGALVRYEVPHLQRAADQEDRPRARDALFGLWRSFLLPALLILSFLFALWPRVGTTVSLIVVLAAVVGLSPVWVAAARPRFRRWRLYSRGACVRGLVVERGSNKSRDGLSLTYTYVADGISRRVSAPVDARVFMGAQVGDEITVCYDPESPSQSAPALLPAARLPRG